MWIWTANKFAKCHAKRLNQSENIPKKFRGATFFWNTLYIVVAKYTRAAGRGFIVLCRLMVSFQIIRFVHARRLLLKLSPSFSEHWQHFSHAIDGFSFNCLRHLCYLNDIEWWCDRKHVNTSELLLHRWLARNYLLSKVIAVRLLLIMPLRNNYGQRWRTVYTPPRLYLGYTLYQLLPILQRIWRIYRVKFTRRS